MDIDTMKRPKPPRDGVKPKHQYDCANCQLNWCCGPLCACALPRLPDPPRSLAWAVHTAQAEWRRAEKAKDILVEIRDKLARKKARRAS